MRPRSVVRLLSVSVVLAAAGIATAAYARPGAPPLRTAWAGDDAPAAGASASAIRQDGANGAAHRNFYFSRAEYTSGGRGGRGRWGRSMSWSTDFPKADQQFLVVLKRLTNLDAYDREHPVRLDDPELRRFPFIYAVEVGYMSLTDAEVKGLREYLLAGGFMVADDFWGTYEWRAFEEQMRRVFPEYSIVDIPRDHPIFNAYYEIGELVQVPNVGQGIAGGQTHERDGYVPQCRGIFDDQGRLMVVINWNTDLGDAWEWAEQKDYPLKFSTFAYQMGVNFIVYAMSH